MPNVVQIKTPIYNLIFNLFIFKFDEHFSFKTLEFAGNYFMFQGLQGKNKIKNWGKKCEKAQKHL